MTTWVSEDQKHTGRAVAVESYTVWLDEPWTTVVARQGAEKIQLASSCSCGWHTDEDEIAMKDTYALVMRTTANGRTSVSRALSERKPRAEWEDHVQDKAQDDAWAKLGDAAKRLREGWDNIAGQEPMDRLRICRSFRRWWLEETERSAVIEARRAGRTWEQIGTALGVSRQAVHERYRSCTDDLSPNVCITVMVDDDSDTEAEPATS
ncbi:hypothetical protein GCM10009839_69480 [Catenulispora yoronensis]|uniref:Uncharacterized protein n=1 Tax=Catenulispora yoronensis TaxID=450799 RepID=A0ABN2VBC1_9ACTN